MIAYLTFGEHFSGIYSGQVIDTCKVLTQLTNKKVKLIALISIRNFFYERKKIKSNYKDALVLPMFPKHTNYKLSIVWLFFVFLIHRPEVIVCRNAIPCYLGLKLKKMKLVGKVVFDARAAEYEQLIEYHVISNPDLIGAFLKMETQAVLNADFRMAVSQKLVEYWGSKFKYLKNNHVVIPCTLNSVHLINNKVTITRKDLGYSEGDIVLIYSGSTAGWQSFSNMFLFFEEQIRENENIRILLLTMNSPLIEEFIAKYPNRIKRFWCSETEIFSYLRISDYGVLIREDSITNDVASPVKFAEYLYAGLKVIISNGIGDFSSFVLNNDCGYVIGKDHLKIDKIDDVQRNKNITLSKHFFSKDSPAIIEKYLKIFNSI